MTNHTATADQLAASLRDRTVGNGHHGCDPVTGLCHSCEMDRKRHAAHRHLARVEAVKAAQRVTVGA